MEPFIGQILIWPISWAPENWAFCNGQLMSINDNQALFALIGNTYGGDGRTTFALPDLRGRMPVGTGTGAGISTRRLGDRSGLEFQQLSSLNLPTHNHQIISQQSISGEVKITVNSEIGEEGNPSNNFLAGTDDIVYSDESGSGQLGGVSSTLQLSGPIECMSTGASQAFNQMNPYLALNFIIALQGIFPTRP